jgi:hypothetical protein
VRRPMLVESPVCIEPLRGAGRVFLPIRRTGLILRSPGRRAVLSSATLFAVSTVVAAFRGGLGLGAP